MEELSNYRPTDDFYIDPLYLKDKAVVINCSLVKEEFGATGKVNEQFYQKIPCLNIECLGVDCIVGGLVIHEDLPIHKAPIPALMPFIGDKDIIYLGTSNMKNNFRRVTMGGFPFNEFYHFTKRRPVYTMVGNEVFLKDLPTSSMKILYMVCILADPRNAPGWDDDVNIFPTPSPFKLEMLIKQDIFKSYGVMPDVSDNAQRAMQQQSPVQAQQQNQEEGQ